MGSWEWHSSTPPSLQAMGAEQKGEGYSQLQHLWAQAPQLCLLAGQGCPGGGPAHGVHLSDAAHCILLAQARAAYLSPLGMHAQHALVTKGTSGRQACGMGAHSACLSDERQLFKLAVTHVYAPLFHDLNSTLPASTAIAQQPPYTSARLAHSTGHQIYLPPRQAHA